MEAVLEEIKAESPRVNGGILPKAEPTAIPSAVKAAAPCNGTEEAL